MQIVGMTPQTTSHSWFRLRLASIIFASFVLSGCAGGLSHSLQQSLSVIAPTPIDFAELEYYAKRSHSAYDPADDIRRDYPLITRIATVQPVDVSYFIETDQENRTQTISIRGTAVKANVWEDIATALIPDKILGISLHRGFQADARAIWHDAQPYLRKDYPVRVTGHSLGGAAASILALYLEKDGYDIERVVTFGEPRFTTHELAKSVSLQSTIRIVHDRDVVPLLPPHSVFGKYKHSSSEVILRPGDDYVFVEQHIADRLSVGEFWRNIANFSLSDHRMDGYLGNIQLKVKEGARQVPYLFNLKRTVEVNN